MAASGVFLLTGLLVYLVMFGAFWVLVNFGVYRMAKHAGIPCPWLGLVPVANAYIIGLLGERALYAYTGRQRRLAFWATIFQAVPLVGMMFVVGLALLDSDFNILVGMALLMLFVGGIAGTVIYWYALYYIFKDYAPDNAVLYTVLGLVLGIYWIFLLVEMNTVPVSVTGFGAFPYGRPKYDRYHQWQAPAGPGQYPPPSYQGNTTSWGPNGYVPGQPQGPYTTNPGGQQGYPQQPYQGQGQQFYQGQGYYQTQGQQAPAESSRGEDGPEGPEVK